MMEHLKDVEGVVTKNLFLKDKKKRLYLLSSKHDTDVKLADLAKKVGASGGLRLADESVLEEVLGVRQGCVNAFSLINDTHHQVRFLVEDSLLAEERSLIYFHPLDNAASTGIAPQDLLMFLRETGHEPTLVNFNS